MKKVLLSILCISLMLSCKKEDTEDIGNKIRLYQTCWEGNLTCKVSGEVYNYYIKIAFNSESFGEYIIDDINPPIDYSKKSVFRYDIKDKKLVIDEGFNNILLGYWWIIDYRSNKIKLRTNVVDETNNKEIYLTKIL